MVDGRRREGWSEMVAMGRDATRYEFPFDAEPGKFPFAVGLRLKDNPACDFFGSGSLVSTRWVLTAAHNIEHFIDLSGEKVYVSFGYRDGGGTSREIESWEIYPYDLDAGRGLAPIRLKQPIPAEPTAPGPRRSTIGCRASSSIDHEPPRRSNSNYRDTIRDSSRNSIGQRPRKISMMSP